MYHSWRSTHVSFRMLYTLWVPAFLLQRQTKLMLLNCVLNVWDLYHTACDEIPATLNKWTIFKWLFFSAKSRTVPILGTSTFNAAPASIHTWLSLTSILTLTGSRYYKTHKETHGSIWDPLLSFLSLFWIMETCVRWSVPSQSCMTTNDISRVIRLKIESKSQR